MQVRVLIHVQHLLGSGHLQRCALLAQALSAQGCAVALYTGGPALPTLDQDGFDLFQLPPLRSPDASFSGLVDADGNAPSAAYHASRRDALLAGLKDRSPQVIVIEGWPFARRKFSREILALLEAARDHQDAPLIVCSIRDVLHQHGKLERYRETVERVRQWFDLVLVHADPSLIRLRDSFPLAASIEDRLAYTGLVCRELPASAEADRHDSEVLVSAGGGDVGRHLLNTALAAATQGAGRAWRWRVLVSHAIAEGEFRRLRAQAPPGVRVERNRADFVDLLRRCRVSLSLAGYNTVAELLRTETPAVLVPFAENDETEQLQRARLLAAAGRCVCLTTHELGAQDLLAALDRAVELSWPDRDFDLDGARRSAEIILQRLQDRS